MYTRLKASKAKQGLAPANNWEAVIKQEGLGRHWQILDQAATTKLQEILDEQNLAYRVIARHIHQLPSMAPMGHKDVVIHLIRSFLDRTNGHVPVHEAAVYLARSSWNVRVASYRWADPENWATMAEDELWGGEVNDQANLSNIHEAMRPVVENHPMTQQEIRIPAQEKLSDTEAIARPPKFASSDKAARTVSTTASLNTTTSTANLDRSQAVKGQVRPDKFTIELGPPDHNTIRKWRFPRDKEKNFDWQNQEHISPLNRWRGQVFRRMVEVSERGRIDYHQDELDWLTEQFVLHKQRALEHGLEPNYRKMDWNSIAQAYNDRFEGKMLPNCEDPRPNRSKASLSTQRYRIEAVCELTGFQMKEPVRGVRKKPAEPATSGNIAKSKEHVRRRVEKKPAKPATSGKSTKRTRS